MINGVPGYNFEIDTEPPKSALEILESTGGTIETFPPAKQKPPPADQKPPCKK